MARRGVKRDVTTRIIGGQYKGKKLKLPDKQVTRSSKNILREALFNILQFDIVDANFVEVFGGSGSIGLEALSRGAKRVYFIEKNGASYDILKENCQRLDIDRCNLYFGDAFELLFDVIRELQERKERAYFYFDPPFQIRQGYGDIYERIAQLIAQIPKEVVEAIIIEHMSKVDLPERIGPFQRYKERRFGKSTLSFYR
ncbi:MAG: 16S rRNA (guanine(966)-N(2))-methyltransferase RsmD [Nitratiruptor sp.]|nr:16S rRNA (guanine(966)-N(2))-methyltransferase RsmD [Nitratiruptor sp.]NPA83311.1 16S rRNA (guanine(966)-N(2))-methyltransferase RsmD [Campylobacterota bacterium]